MATHKHAALMQQYAKDWAETEEPWKRWEVTSHRNEWVALCGHPYWKEESEYRRKPRTVKYWHCVARCVLDDEEGEEDVTLWSTSGLDDMENEIKQFKSHDKNAKFSPIIETTAELED